MTSDLCRRCKDGRPRETCRHAIQLVPTRVAGVTREKHTQKQPSATDAGPLARGDECPGLPGGFTVRTLIIPDSPPSAASPLRARQPAARRARCRRAGPPPRCCPRRATRSADEPWLALRDPRHAVLPPLAAFSRAPPHPRPLAPRLTSTQPAVRSPAGERLSMLLSAWSDTRRAMAADPRPCPRRAGTTASTRRYPPPGPLTYRQSLLFAEHIRPYQTRSLLFAGQQAVRAAMSPWSNHCPSCDLPHSSWALHDMGAQCAAAAAADSPGPADDAAQ